MYIGRGYSLIAEEWIYLILTAVLLILFITGKKVALSAAFSAIILPKFENVFGCGSISTPLFVYFGIFMAMWEWLNRKYELEKPENEDTGLQVLDKLYWFLLASYGILNLLSAFVHIKDPYWQSGQAMGMFYSHFFWGRWFEFFRSLEQNEYWLWFSKILTWSVIISQCLIIPAYLFKTSRKWLFVWFVILLINIGLLVRVVFLPHFTLLLCILLFYKRSPRLYGKNLFGINSSFIQLNRFLKTFYIIGGILLLLKTPGISNAMDKVFWSVREWDTRVWLMKKTSQIGYFQPVVINADHLEGHKRFVLHRFSKQSGWEKVKILADNGARLSYWPDPLFTENQGLEQIYANTMGHITGYDSFTYENSPTPYKWKRKAIHRLITLDYFASGQKGKVSYKADYYERKYPSKDGKASRNYQDTLVRSIGYKYDGSVDHFEIITLTREHCGYKDSVPAD